MADNINSYIGYAGNTFYAGPNGESFQIREIFPNRKAMDDSLATSKLAIGDYVIVSYGDPSSTEYEDNKAIDINQYGNSWNASLWQKAYQKNEQNQYEIVFTHITSFPASVPSISFLAPRADNPKTFIPWVSDNTGTVDAPEFQFNIPNAWNIAVTGDATRAANQYATIEQTSENDTTKTWTVHFPKAYIFSPSASVDNTKNVNSAPTITIGQLDQDGQTLPIAVAFPPAWLAIASKTIGNADSDPNVTLDTSDNRTQKFAFTLPKTWTFAQPQSDLGNAGTQPSVTQVSKDASTGIITWKFTLPKTWQLTQPGYVLGNAGTQPSVAETARDATTGDITWTFTLPKTWQFATPQYEPLPAGSQPTVTHVSSDPTTGDITWKFSLPRSTHILTGSGAPASGTVQNEDYYIDINSGDIYDATHVQPIGCFMPPTPAVTNTHPDAYVYRSGVWTENDAEVGIITKNTEGKWVFPFSLPKAPHFIVGSTAQVGSTENANVIGSPINSSTFQFNFTIPRGTRWFSGNIDPSLVTEAAGLEQGDYYFQSSTGEVFYYNGTVWILKGSLMGDSLEIYSRVNITEYATRIIGSEINNPSSEVEITDSDPAFSLPEEQRIKAILDLLYPTTKPKTSQLLDVFVLNIITDTRDTYFAYYLNNQWQLMQLNSGIGSLFMSTVSESQSADNMGYSVNALNAALSWGSFNDLEDIE